jgi:hypothetical protein
MHAVFFLWDILRTRSKQRLEESKLANTPQLEALKIKNDKAFGGYAVLLWQTYLKREPVPWLQGESNVHPSAPYPVKISDRLFQEVTSALEISATTRGGNIPLPLILYSKEILLEETTDEIDAAPGRVFREIYTELEEYLSREIFQAYLNSAHFLVFLDGVGRDPFKFFLMATNN